MNSMRVAVAPNGKRAYVTNLGSNKVSVINTATNTVAATVNAGANPAAVAVTPDGTKAYIANRGANTVSVIKTSNNTVLKTVAVGQQPNGVAVSPDGQSVYVTNSSDDKVSVIGTASDTVTATITVGNSPGGVGFASDGKTAYVSNVADNTLSLIDTTSKTVTATVPAGNTPFGVAVRPPSPGIAFARLEPDLEIWRGHDPTHATFDLHSSFTLAPGSRHITPLTEAVTLQIGPYTTLIPPDSFEPVGSRRNAAYRYRGIVQGVALKASLTPQGTSPHGAQRYSLRIQGKGMDFSALTSPVAVTLGIGDDSTSQTVRPRAEH